MFELGLKEMLVYHCIRCNYYWLSRYFDTAYDDDIMKMEPPKVCARCKSKYWKELPLSRTKKYEHAKFLNPLGRSIVTAAAAARDNDDVSMIYPMG